MSASLPALVKFTRLLDRVSEWSGRAVAWLALLMVLVGAWNALSRWLGRHIGFDFSSNGLIEAQWYLFALLFLLAGSYTLKHNGHVRVDIVYARTSKRSQAIIDVIGTLFLLLPFCVFAIIYTWQGALESWHVREVSPDPGGLPRYPLKAVVPIAFALIILQGTSELLKRILVLRGGDPPEAEVTRQRPEGA